MRAIRARVQIEQPVAHPNRTHSVVVVRAAALVNWGLLDSILHTHIQTVSSRVWQTSRSTRQFSCVCARVRIVLCVCVNGRA